MNKVIAVDFDGTLCRSRWPEVGESNDGLIEWLKYCRENGDKVILWTCREGKLLAAAVAWCADRGLMFDAVNQNLPERIEYYGNDCRKVSADIYLDDRAIGVYYPPKQSKFYVYGTKGETICADVELHTGELATEKTPEKHVAGIREPGNSGWQEAACHEWQEPWKPFDMDKTKIYNIGPYLQRNAHGKTDPRRVTIENGYIAPWKRSLRAKLRWCWIILRNKS